MAIRLPTSETFLSLILLAGAAPLSAHETPPPPRSVSVSGEGEVSVAPDRARLSMGVDEVSKDVKAAEASVNKVVRGFLARARQLGAKDKDIQTTGTSIHPEYEWNEKARKRELIGYRVRRDIVVLVRDLDKLGDFLLGATQSGVNNMHPPALESSKAKELENEALVLATKDARDRATLLAETLKVKLGAVRNISAHQSQPSPPVMMKDMMVRAEAHDGNAQMGIVVGEIRYRSAVQAEFDLVP